MIFVCLTKPTSIFVSILKFRKPKHFLKLEGKGMLHDWKTQPLSQRNNTWQTRHPIYYAYLRKTEVFEWHYLQQPNGGAFSKCLRQVFVHLFWFWHQLLTFSLFFLLGQNERDKVLKVLKTITKLMIMIPFSKFLLTKI